MQRSGGSGSRHRLRPKHLKRSKELFERRMAKNNDSFIGCLPGRGEGYFCPTTPPVTPLVRSGDKTWRAPISRGATDGRFEIDSRLLAT